MTTLEYVSGLCLTGYLQLVATCLPELGDYTSIAVSPSEYRKLGQIKWLTKRLPRQRLRLCSSRMFVIRRLS